MATDPERMEGASPCQGMLHQPPAAGHPLGRQACSTLLSGDHDPLLPRCVAAAASTAPAAAAATEQPPTARLLSLPDDLLHLVLRGTPLLIRAVCRSFRTLQDAGRTSLHLRWDAVGESTDVSDAAWAAAGGPAPRRVRSALSRLPQLCTLSAAGAVYCDLASIAVPSLTSLNVDLIRGTTTIHPLTACVALITLNLSNCIQLVDLSGLQGSCRSLTSLGLFSCHALTDVGALSECSRLTHLTLENAMSLPAIDPICQCRALRVLTLNGGANPALTDLALLAALPALAVLNLRSGDQVLHVSHLSACAALQHFTLRKSRWLPQLRGWEVLGGCLSLRLLRLPAPGDEEEEVSRAALTAVRPDLRIVIQE